MSMTNLTRPGTFGVTGSFGVDYAHQLISATDIPQSLNEGICAAINASNLGEALEDVRVELAEAGDSSLNYWIFVTMDSSAAFSYFRVERLIQSACIQICSDKAWSIPFPHVALVRKPDAETNAQGGQPAAPLGATG